MRKHYDDLERGQIKHKGGRKGEKMDKREGEGKEERKYCDKRSSYAGGGSGREEEEDRLGKRTAKK